MQAVWNSVSGKGTTSLTRLNCMQDAILVHLERLELQFPQRKVAVIAFESRLECYIGGAILPQVINPSGVKSIEEFMDKAATIRQPAESTVRQTGPALKQRIMGLTTKGATALGSALALALGLARQHKHQTGAATEIFLCTDGACTTGIGCVESPNNDRNQHGRSFYSRAGEMAIEVSAKIHIIGIQGEGVALDVLAVAAQISGGTVTTVLTDELRREIRTASQRRIVAKEVTVKLHAPRGWHFLPDPRPGVLVARNTLTYTLANVDDDTTVGFAFAIDSKVDSKGDSKGETAAFQAEITYSSPRACDRRVRILNKELPVTADREHAESAIQVAVVGAYALQRIAFDASQMMIRNLTTKRLVWPLRGALYATHLLLIRGTATVVQREELACFAAESATLDQQLDSIVSRDGGYGVRRDNAAKIFSRLSTISTSVLFSGSKKTGQVQRWNQLR